MITVLSSVKLLRVVSSVCGIINRHLRKHDVYTSLKRKPPSEHPASNQTRESYLEMLLSIVSQELCSSSCLPAAIAQSYARINLGELLLRKLTNYNQSRIREEEVIPGSNNYVTTEELSPEGCGTSQLVNNAHSILPIENINGRTASPNQQYSHQTEVSFNIQKPQNSTQPEQSIVVVARVNDFDDEISNHYHDGATDLEESIGRLRMLLEQRKEAEEDSQNFTRSLSEPAKTCHKSDQMLRTFSLKDKHSCSVNGDVQHEDNKGSMAQVC